MRAVAMRTVAALAFASWLVPRAAAALTPQDFAYGMPIMATQVAAAYRVQLPVDVYKVSMREDLGDVRVFNAQGEAVPYAITPTNGRNAGMPSPAAATQSLALFPLHGDAQAGTPGLRVTLDSPNGAIKLQAEGRTAGDAPVTQYLLDARPFDAAIAALQLSWPESSADFSGRMRIECSDDLANWRLVVAAAPIANLHAGTQQLIESRIETPNIQAKFWRLSWLGHGPSFELGDVRAQGAQGPPRIDWSTLVVTGKADPHSAGDYDFDLGARFPLERVNLILPDTNSVYLADFKSRAHAKDAWREVTRAGVYRLATADGQQSNGPIEVALNRDRYWRVHLSGDSANVAVRLEVSFTPGELTFVAHGPPPYMLAYGSNAVSAAATDLSVMPSGALISTATLGSRSPLGGESRIAAGGSPFDQRNVLWSVLVIGVAGLATMAARLARDRRLKR
jgi:hypothetical protein